MSGDLDVVIFGNFTKPQDSITKLSIDYLETFFKTTVIIIDTIDINSIHKKAIRRQKKKLM